MIRTGTARDIVNQRIEHVIIIASTGSGGGVGG